MSFHLSVSLSLDHIKIVKQQIIELVKRQINEGTFNFQSEIAQQMRDNFLAYRICQDENDVIDPLVELIGQSVINFEKVNHVGYN